MIPSWLHILSILMLIIGGVCALVIALDLVRGNRQHMLNNEYSLAGDCSLRYLPRFVGLFPVWPVSRAASSDGGEEAGGGAAEQTPKLLFL